MRIDLDTSFPIYSEMNHNCLKALIMCRIRKDDRDIEGGGERIKMLSGD